MIAPITLSNANGVSLLVRSMARETLYRCLGSLALSQGQDIEVVVVNATGQPHPPLADRCGPHPLRLLNPGQALCRAAAANFALQQAHGRWSLFVDDDDSLDPHHVERLRTALLADPQATAAYAGVRLMHADGTSTQVLDEPFDLLRLHCENFLPIHAVMFNREAVCDGLGPAPWFDESLSVYEDWDFWLRLAQHHRFVHVPGVSASYHLAGQSGLTHQTSELVTGAGRARFFAKWAPLIQAPILEALTRRAEVDRSRTLALEHAREGLAAALAEQDHTLQQSRADLQTTQRGVDWLKDQERQALSKWAEAQHLLQQAQHLLQETQRQAHQTVIELQAAQSERAAVQARWHEAVAQWQAIQARWHDSQAQNTHLLAQQQQQVLQEQAQQADLARLNAHLTHSQAEVQDLHHQAQRTHQQLALAQQQLADAQQQLADARQQQTEAQQQLADARQQQTDAQQQITLEREARQALEAALALETAQARKVRADLQSAERSYRQLESGYGQVTQSFSWRATEPLRRVRSLFSAADGVSPARKLVRGVLRRLPVSGAQKSKIKVWMVARPWAARWLPWMAISTSVAVAPRTPLFPIAGGVSPASTPSSAPTVAAKLEFGVDKNAVRAEAENGLTIFLDSQQRIDLHPQAGPLQVSVVVVLYNQAGLTHLCLQSLQASVGVSFEVLIVDNASTDRVPQLLSRVDGARLLPQTENLGFLRAVNLAAEHARGEYLLLLNNDAMVEPHTLKHAVQRLAREPSAGAVGGPILLWDGRLQEAGSIVWRDGSCLGYGRGDDPALPAYHFVRDVDYCSGAMLMVRRALFEELGRFDEVFAPAYYEESDFCVRLWEHGHRVVYDPAVRVKHFEFASDAGSGRAIELQTRNRARFVARHTAFLADRPAPDLANLLRARQRLASGKLRVLVIDDRVPLPWLGQGYPRAAHIVRVLAAEGHFVTHYPLQFPHEHPEHVARALPDTVEVMVDRGLAGLAAFLTERQDLYDAVIVSRPHNMQVLTSITAAQPQLLRGVRIVYDAEALFSLRDIAKAQVLGQPLDEREQRRQIDAEMALAQGADTVLTVSALEASHYQAAGYADVHVLGHALEVKPTPALFEARRGFLFVGALMADDTPNADSLVWFITQVWPLVRQALGDQAVLNVVGPCEAPAVSALAGPSVLIHGAVESLHASFDAARVFVAPTRYAAGIAHKAHEAAAFGVPMVTSPLIAAQLGWGEVVAVGATAANFAQACVALHTDAESWRQAVDQGLVAVRQDCDPQGFVAGVLTALGLPQSPVQIPVIEAVEPPVPPTPSLPSIEEESNFVEEPLTEHGRRLVELRKLMRAQAQAASAASATAAERTADHWGQDAQARLNELNRYRYWASHPVTARHINLRVSGDPNVGWVQHLQRTHFRTPGSRGISLGCGSGAVVVDAVLLNAVQAMEGVDISPGALAVAKQRAREAGVQDRALFRVADLNRPVLQGPYDLVLFEQSLHHIDSLGEVLDECARALAPNGLFVINEYVGPDRFQWDDVTQQLMASMLQRLPERYRIEPLTGTVRSQASRVTAEQVIAVDPSEAIHSSQILRECASRFDVVEKREFGGTLLAFGLAEIIANFDPDSEQDVSILNELIEYEESLILNGTLKSDFAVAVYKKRP